MIRIGFNRESPARMLLLLDYKTFFFLKASAVASSGGKEKGEGEGEVGQSQRRCKHR